jgi:hypothetical protein
VERATPTAITTRRMIATTGDTDLLELLLRRKVTLSLWREVFGKICLLGEA